MTRWVALVVGLSGLTACTKDNPLWGLGDGEADSGSTTGVDTATTAGSTSTATVTASSGNSTTTGTSSGGSSAGSGSTGSIEIAPPLDCGELDADVVAYYRFETIDDMPMVDETGNHNGIMWMDNDPDQDPGPTGCGNAFVGGDMIAGQVADSADFDLERGSIDFWVRPPAPTATQRALVSRDNQGNGPGHLTIMLSTVTTDGTPRDGHLVVRHQDGVSVARCSVAPLPPGMWAHVGYNFGPNGVELFIDGVLQQTDGIAEVPGNDLPCDGIGGGGVVTDNDLFVGGSELNGSLGFFYRDGGALDEVRISAVRRDFGS